ncbi:hypothetical protein GIB67_014361 [Kingdonia uniflora]|uniref:SAC domain-containing protein n=1 Tax=Kingdonia uniflora TaxID=39325 RepID=A0A7J7NTC8_9MAGN|nr:hypothetical protein GIB67_014361 [Kingdonia uniflora]
MENSISKEGFKLLSQMELLEFPEKLVFRSLDSPQQQSFSIDRSDGNIDPQFDITSLGVPNKVTKIYGVVGTIRLLAGLYVLVITSRKDVGNYLGFPVFRLLSMKFMACNKTSKLSTCQEKSDEAYFMSLLKTVESTPGLYYSYETDLTLNLQRTSKLAKGRIVKPLWKQADPRFIWNKNLLEELIECKLDSFIIPLIQGSFKTAEFALKGSSAKFTLVSRRCTRRLGTRMWRRGANLEGDTANFIETEQLLEFEGFRSSILQVRGSIPLLWEQIVDLSYKPRIKIINHEQTPKIVEHHFHDLTQRYGETIAIDLTDKHGDEGELSAAYAAEIKKLPNIRYISFDFHQHCRKSTFDGLELLYEQIYEDIEKQGYFLMDSEGNILVEQRGVIRVNCIDCLDRTNVTQSYLARMSLNSELRRMGALSSKECLSMYTGIYGKFKKIWAEQGDEISLEYSGTKALKGDLVRFGKQTVLGLIKDGISALSRYYLNNFHDGIRQDAMDLISGRYTVNKSSPSPFQLNGFESFSYLPVASALLVGGITITSITLNQVGRNAQHFISTVIWAGLTAGVLAVVKANGRQFCSRPRLCSLL